MWQIRGDISLYKSSIIIRKWFPRRDKSDRWGIVLSSVTKWFVTALSVINEYRKIMATIYSRTARFAVPTLSQFLNAILFMRSRKETKQRLTSVTKWFPIGTGVTAQKKIKIKYLL
jgi:hypothetical protein